MLIVIECAILNEKFKTGNILNPSREASTISPGRRPKNFLPAFEFATLLVKISDTFTTPERTPLATFSVLFVILLTLQDN